MDTSKLFGVIAVLLLFALIYVYESFDEQLEQQGALIQSLQRDVADLSSKLETLDPLRKVMSAYDPGRRIPDAYKPIQATGAPNVEPGLRDDPRAWCPGRKEGSLEWLELGYPLEMELAKVVIHSSFNPCAVSRVIAVRDEKETLVWEGKAEVVSTAVKTITVNTPIKTKRIKLVLDTSAVSGWNEIDAVELIGVDGQKAWAVEARASSHWQSDG